LGEGKYWVGLVWRRGRGIEGGVPVVTPCRQRRLLRRPRVICS
jgi:hypothetical protein